jgi:hypothetical protein
MKTTRCVYTVRLPGKLLSGLFVNYIDAVDWKDIIKGEDTVMISVDKDTYDALSALD